MLELKLKWKKKTQKDSHEIKSEINDQLNVYLKASGISKPALATRIKQTFV